MFPTGFVQKIAIVESSMPFTVSTVLRASGPITPSALANVTIQVAIANCFFNLPVVFHFGDLKIVAFSYFLTRARNNITL